VGACRIAAAAEQAGHAVRFLDCMFSRRPQDELAAQLAAFEPQVVGISIRNMDNNDMTAPLAFDQDAARLAAVVREHSFATVVIGGPAIGLDPEFWLRRMRADLAVMGPGEEVFPKVLEALGRGMFLTRIPNLAWIDQNRFCRTRSRLPESGLIAAPAAPVLGRWLNVARYRERQSPIPVQSKRGCPYACVYCTYARDEGRDYQLFTPDSVARTITELADQGHSDMEFVDNVFNSPYEHALALCRRLGEMRLHVRLHSVEMNPRFIDDALLSAMERAGFAGMGVTAESASDPVLQGLGKNFHKGHLERAARAIRRHAIPTFWIFLLGGPGETHETVEQTMEFAAQMIRPQDVAFFNLGIRIYPGTRLEQIARRQGVIGCGHDLSQPVFYLSPRLNPDRLRRRLDTELAKRMNFLAYRGLQHPLLPLVLTASTAMGVKPPLWRHTSRLRRAFRTAGLNV